MKRLLTLILSLIALGALANARPAPQRARIRQGVRSGSLTRGEAARLRAGQRLLRKQARLQNRKIARLKHNRRNRVF